MELRGEKPIIPSNLFIILDSAQRAFSYPANNKLSKKVCWMKIFSLVPHRHDLNSHCRGHFTEEETEAERRGSQAAS